MNGDGEADIVTANDGNSNVSIFPGLGDGTFPIRHDHPTGELPVAIALADLDGDGQMDIVTASELRNSVSVLLNDGFDFPTYTEYMTETSPLSVAATDLTGDGRPDLVVGNYGSGGGQGATISVFLNLGDGTFGPKSDIAGFSGPHISAVGDLNGDGKADLVVGNAPCCGTSAISVLLGQGNGLFDPAVSYPVGACPEGAVIRDFNHDGHEDIAVANHCDSTLSVLLGTGGGAFASSTSYSSGPGPNRLGVGDLDGDGELDLVASDQYSFGTPTVSVILGSGDGTFGPFSLYATGTPPLHYDISDVEVADLNRDLLPDIVAANPYSGAVSVLLNAGKATATLVSSFLALTAESGLEIRWEFSDASRIERIRLDRREAGSDSWIVVWSGASIAGRPSSIVDEGVLSGRAYDYRLVSSEGAGTPIVLGMLSVVAGAAIPDFALSPVTPNPTSGRARVGFAVPRECKVRIGVFDVQGREVAVLRDEIVKSGRYEVTWDGMTRSGAARSGLYFVRFETPERVHTGRLILNR